MSLPDITSGVEWPLPVLAADLPCLCYFFTSTIRRRLHRLISAYRPTMSHGTTLITLSLSGFKCALANSSVTVFVSARVKNFTSIETV